MASDLPPYLTRSPHRNVPWTGHAIFPRRSVAHHEELEKKWGKDYLKDLRIFKLFGMGQAIEYRLLSDEEVQRYMDDPNRV